jgi:hypothetical protein
MAYLPPILHFIDVCLQAHRESWEGRKMLELGNQRILHSFWGKDYNAQIAAQTGKEYYEDRGFLHYSIDMNGEDGSLPLDLSRPLPTDAELGRFDVITNAGTTEHVEPLSGQYECFKTIHDLCAPGGLMIHVVPGVEDLRSRGYWRYHCNNYYSSEFFRELARANGYRIHRLEEVESLLAVCIEKCLDEDFSKDRRRFCSLIRRRLGGLVYEGVNDAHCTIVSRLARPLFDRLRRRHVRRMIEENQRDQTSL